MSAACRDLNKLHPFVKNVAEAFLAECKKQGLKLGISETYRTVERQDLLYAQGRTKPGVIISNARGKDMASYHQWGLAFDIYHDKPGDLYNVTILNDAGKIGQKMGLEWGGAWKGFVDKPHFQYTFGLSIADLKAGKKPLTTVKESAEVEKQITIQLNGVNKKVTAIEKDGNNYIKLQDIRDHFIKVDYDSLKKIPVIEARS